MPASSNRSNVSQLHAMGKQGAECTQERKAQRDCAAQKGHRALSIPSEGLPPGALRACACCPCRPATWPGPFAASVPASPLGSTAAACLVVYECKGVGGAEVSGKPATSAPQRREANGVPKPKPKPEPNPNPHPNPNPNLNPKPNCRTLELTLKRQVGKKIF